MKSPRRLAAERGERIYIGKPCKRGHDGTRHTASGNCILCQRERSQALTREIRELLSKAA